MFRRKCSIDLGANRTPTAALRNMRQIVASATLGCYTEEWVTRTSQGFVVCLQRWVQATRGFKIRLLPAHKHKKYMCKPTLLIILFHCVTRIVSYM
jgi:hypothetical protein